MMTKLTEKETREANLRELIEYGLNFNKNNIRFITPIYELSMMISLNEILAFRRIVKFVYSRVKDLPEEGFRKIALINKIQSFMNLKPLKHMGKVQHALQRKIIFQGIHGDNGGLLDFGSSNSSSGGSAQMNFASGFSDGQSKIGGGGSQLDDSDDAKSLFSQPHFNFIFNGRRHKKSEDTNSLFNF